MISNLSSYFIIDIDKMLNDITLDSSMNAHRFVINAEIQRMIINASRSKRYLGIVYIYSGMNRRGVSGLRKTVLSVKNQIYEKFNTIDYAETPKHEDLYDLFDEVAYITSYKKNRI